MAVNYQLLIVFAIGVIGANAWNPGEKPILPVPTECPLEDPKNYTVHLAHESDCTKFYKCFAGKKYEMQCPLSWQGGRLHFHKVLQVCTYPKDAGCELPAKSSESTESSESCQSGEACKSSSSSSESCQSGEACKSSSSSEDKSDSKGSGDGKDSSEGKDSGGDKDSSDGKDSGEGKDSSGDKDNSGSKGNSDEIDSSDDSDSSDCNEEDPCPPGSDGKKIPHECVCNKYYVCKDGNLILQSCRRGLHWSTSRNKCVKAALMQCR